MRKSRLGAKASSRSWCSHDLLCTDTLTLYQTIGQCYVHKTRLNTEKKSRSSRSSAQMNDQPFSSPSHRPKRGAKLPRFRCCRSLFGHEARRGRSRAEPSRAAVLLKSHKGAAAKLIMALADELGAACLAVTLQIAL